MNIAIFKNTFFKNICEWLLLITAINRRYFEKYLLQNFNYKMLHNSISVDRKLYSLQQKQKSTAVFPMEFCEQLHSQILFGAALERAVTLVVSGFHSFQGSDLLSHERRFLLETFLHSAAFQFELCYPFFMYLEKA